MATVNQATAGTPSNPSGGYRSVFRVREFRAVFAAHLMSVLGVVVAEIALTVLVYRLTGSPLMSALTFALGFLPYALGGTLLAGTADRRPARRVLVGCDLVCAVCAAAMVLPGTPVAGLLVLRCAMAFVAPLFQGARSASLADILGSGETFVLGRSLLRMVAQSAQLIGFGLGGLLLTVLAPRGAIALTAAGFLGSALLLRFGTRARPARAAAAGRTSPLAGLRAVFGERRLRVLTLLFWLPPVFLVVPEALLAPYADGLGAGTAALGLLMCALPVGTIAGELWAGSVLTARTRSRIVAPLAAVGLLPLLVYAVRPGPVAVLAALLLAGLAHAYTLGLDRMYVDAVPEELRGRAMTLLSTGMMTLQGAGMALAGLAAEFLAVHVVVTAAAVLGTGVVLLLLAELRATARPLRGPRNETGLAIK
ncbi:MULTISPECIES: MFS transporter [unclassified Streptomyces]|uniref:MFS transporter n=1 Tax=unclassified Streptomyces TaxID=2593676 RepID=UPI001BE54577|nr:MULTISPECIES: MFS transporter [unclassified Streptomyces]MBT2403920.1 MFS transporter [Streptomyces sp. ISL-21]MBT2613173.1 MFS transporter [Streptomyces sp. ISL-87]